MYSKLSRHPYCARIIITGVSFIAVFSIVFLPVAPAQAADDSTLTATPVWEDLGPGQIRSNAVNNFVNVEGMNSTYNPTTGAITKVLVDPGNSNIIYAGSVNGGIWKTTDNGTNWNPLTNRLSSLSIGAMNFDSTDATNNTIIAGTGKQSAFGFVSGPLTGIQYSTNGGTSWVEKRGTAADIYGKDITGVAARGTVMMATVRDMDTPITTVGLYRSTDGGTTFSNSVTGLPVGNIQNLAADPSNTTRFYLSVVNGNDTMTGIYRSDDTGASWTQVKVVIGLKASGTSKADGRILLSVGAGGVLIAQVQQGKDLLEIWRTADQGSTWKDLGIPSTPNFTGLFPGNQPEVHGAVLADPSDPYVVYAAGDTQYTNTNSSIGANQWTCPIFRGVYNPDTGVTIWTYITNDNTLSGSAPHADSRTFAVDSNGRLLFGGDGGLNAYSYPATTKQYDWFPIMNNLRTTEMTQSCWNSITHTASAAAQDVGAYYQFPGQKGSYDWSSTRGGDGGPGPVNVVTFKDTNISVVYASSQYLGGFRRFEVGKTDDAVTAATTLTRVEPYLLNGSNKVYIVGDAGYMSFLSSVALNRANPNKMAIGGKYLFIGTDDPNQKVVSPDYYYEFPVTSILTPTNEISSLAYGTNDKGLNTKPNALLAGAGYNATTKGYLYYTANADPAIAMTPLVNYDGKYVWKAIFDERDGNRFYVADGADVWRSTNTGVAFSKINGEGTGKLPDTFVDRRGLAFASANGVNTLFVGGVSNIKDGSGIYVSRFTGTAGDETTPTWSSFGGSLANAPVYGLSYDTTDDVLLVNLLGRGAWAVYDLTTYFPEATSLTFGKADNDSAPAFLLTDGTAVGASTTFSRGLVKSGAGTLTLSGTNTYSGGTTISSGVLSIAGTGSLPGWNTSGSYSVANGAALAVGDGVPDASIVTIVGTSNFLSGASLGFDTSAGNRAYAAVIGDTSVGKLGLVKIGANTLTLLNNNTYTGVTTISAGNISVATIGNGGVAGNLGKATNAAGNLVFNGGTLQYTGATASTDRNFTINTGKTATIDVTTNNLTMSGASTTTTGALTKTGAGTLILSGANAYTGATTVSAGTLKAGVVTQAFGVGSAVTVGAAGTLDLCGFNETIGSLAGAAGGIVTNTGAAGTLTAGDANATTFSGVIKDGTGTTSLTKQGTGTLTLSGANIYSGGTTISSGVLSIAGKGSLPGWDTSGSYSVASGSALAVYNAVINSEITTMLTTTNFAAGSALGFDTAATTTRTYSDTLADTLQGKLGLTKLGAGTLTLNVVNTYTGATTITAGILNANSSAALGAPTNTLVFNGGTLQAGAAITSATTRLVTLTSTGIIDTNGYDVSIAGVMSGAGGLTKTGASTLTLSGDNTYTGATTVSAGTLKAGVVTTAFGNKSSVTLNGGSLDLNGYSNTIGPLNGIASSTVALGSETLTITTTAATVTSASINGNYAGVISGAGGLTVAGTGGTGGTQILTGANTYTGTTTISDGTLQIGDVVSDAATTGTLGTGTVINNATLTFKRTDSLTVSNAISGSGVLKQEGTGILTLSGANIYSGGTTISSGVLSIAGKGSLPGWDTSGSYSVASGSALAVYNAVINSEITTMLTTTNFAAGSALGFDTAATTTRTYSDTLADTLQGKLGLTKLGAGTLTLNVVNTYTGATTITAGILNANSSAALGAPTNTLVFNGGTLQAGAAITSATTRLVTLTSTGIIDTNGYDVSIAGVMSGAGGLTKTGASTLTLSGDNTYTGATTVSAGTLKAGVVTQAFGVGSAVTVGAAGTLDLCGFNETIGSLAGAAGGIITNTGAAGTLTAGDAASTTFSGVIQDGIGTTSLTKQGIGTLTLDRANTYTGATTVSVGTLKAGVITTAFGDKSSVTLNNTDGGGLDLNGFDNTIGSLDGVAGSTVALGSGILTTGAGTSDSYAGVILGSGGLTVAGAGTQILTGANLYSGTTTISGTSTLQIGDAGTTGALGTGPVTNNSSLVFNRTGSLTVSNVISGTGTLKQKGAGTLILSGRNLYVGGTQINAGTLRIGDPQALGTGAVANNATLDIGSITLTIGGDYAQAATATLMVAVSGASNGSIVATGKATAADGYAVALNISNYVPNNQTYKIIGGAAGGDIKTPTITTPGYNNALFTATTVGNDLILTASRSAANGFAADAGQGDPNAAAVGTVLDNITNPTPGMQTVLNTLDGLSDSQAASSLDTMTPEVNAGVIDTSTTALNNFVGVAIDRVENILTIAMAPDPAKTGMSAGDEDKTNGIWGKGYGSYLTQGMRNNIAGYDAWNAGTALGADHIFLDCFTLGASGGYAYGNVDSDVNNGNTYISSAQTTVYGGYSDQNLPFFIDAAGSFAYNWYNGKRDINVGNVILNTANASYDGRQYGVYIGGGYKFNLTKNIEFTPLISLQWNHLCLDSYTETQAGALNLSVASQDYDQLQSGIGARIASPRKCAWCTFTTEAHGKWFYDFIGDPFAATSNFNGGGADFGSNGCKPAINSFNAGGQLIFDFKNDVSIIGNCDTEMKDQFFGIYGSVTLRYDF